MVFDYGADLFVDKSENGWVTDTFFVPPVGTEIQVFNTAWSHEGVWFVSASKLVSV